MKKYISKSIIIIFGAFFPCILFAEVISFVDGFGIPALTVQNASGEVQTYSLNIQVLGVMTALTVLPALLLAMTSFTRIIIVMGIVRHALGMPQTPSNQILIGLSLFLTAYIMSPIISNINEQALMPYMAENISFPDAIKNAKEPLKDFMISQTRSHDIEMFANLKENAEVVIDDNYLKDIPFSVLVPSFLVSELKTAFQIGFLIFIPFLVIDIVVASVLMAMGMMMLSPLIISLPFKIMLFVLIDGWNLITGTLGASFSLL